MQIPEPAAVEWKAFVEGNIEFHEPDAENYEKGLIQDVLEAGKAKRLKEFTITFNKLNLVYGVDLKTGEFIIGGLRADLAPEVPKCNLRLIYFMRKRGYSGPHQYIFSQKPEGAPGVDDEGNNWQRGSDGLLYGWVKDTRTLSERVDIHRFLLGWQTTCDGRNTQRILFIDPKTGKFELRSKR